MKVAYSAFGDCFSSMVSSKSLLSLLLGFLLLTLPAFGQGRTTKGDRPLSIAQGRKVELVHFMVTGRTTIFEFTSEYCPPCRAYADPLYQLHRKRNDLAIVKVDINRSEIHRIDWESPVAVQYALRSLPHFKVYGPDGKLIAEGQEARRLVDGWIAAME